MTMARVIAKDEGHYSLTAYNDLGSSSREWCLNIFNSTVHEDYDDIEIHVDESVASEDGSDLEFIETTVSIMIKDW